MKKRIVLLFLNLVLLLSPYVAQVFSRDYEVGLIKKEH